MIKAKFIKNKSIPDRVEVYPNKTLIKQWVMKNNGTESWPEGTKLQYMKKESSLSSLEKEYQVKAIKPGECVDISAVLTTPSEPGRSTAYFRLVDHEGNHFGPRIWCDVIVIPPDDSNSHPIQSIIPQLQSSVPSAPSALIAPSAPTLIPPSVPSALITPNVPTQTTNSLEQKAYEEKSDATMECPDDGMTDSGEKVWKKELQELATMGFHDTATIIFYLEQHNGDVQAVCNSLLS